MPPSAFTASSTPEFLQDQQRALRPPSQHRRRCLRRASSRAEREVRDSSIRLALPDQITEPLVGQARHH